MQFYTKNKMITLINLEMRDVMYSRVCLSWAGRANFYDALFNTKIKTSEPTSPFRQQYRVASSTHTEIRTWCTGKYSLPQHVIPHNGKIFNTAKLNTFPKNKIGVSALIKGRDTVRVMLRVRIALE